MKNVIYYLNRQGEMNTFQVNSTDYLFKQALQMKDLEQVKEILGQGNLCGHSIVQFLKDQGHSEIALFFEKDIRSRFNLAISSGNIQVALDAARELKEKDAFLKLAQLALTLGNYEITEKCLQAVKSLDKLNFFYSVTGSFGKLHKMQSLGQQLDDPMLRFNSASMVGDVEEKVKVLA